jgi:hypothetical protein
MAASLTQQSSTAAFGQLGMAAALQPRMIDPQELTLGALIGEGGFGKVPTETFPMPDGCAAHLHCRVLQYVHGV